MAPAFYSPGDQAIYNRGFSFIPRDIYRFGDPNLGTSTTAAPATGINTLVPQNISGISGISDGGGGDLNPFNADMSQIRQDYSPYAARQYYARPDSDVGIPSGILSNSEFLYGKKSPLEGLINFIPGIGTISRVAGFLKDKLPINQRAIFENELRGSGVFTDDLGRIVAAPGGYNTPEGIMAGYNANRMTGETFDKRTDTISETLGNKYGLSQSDIQGIIDGTLDDEDIANKYGISTNLISNLRNINIAKQNFITQQNKAKQIADFKEAQRKAKTAEKIKQKAFIDAQNAKDSDDDGVPDYVEKAGGTAPGGMYATDYQGDPSPSRTTSSNTRRTGGGNYEGKGGGADLGGGSIESQTNSQAGAGGFYDFAKGGRVYYMNGGLADLVDIYD